MKKITQFLVATLAVGSAGPVKADPSASACMQEICGAPERSGSAYAKLFETIDWVSKAQASKEEGALDFSPDIKSLVETVQNEKRKNINENVASLRVIKAIPDGEVTGFKKTMFGAFKWAKAIDGLEIKTIEKSGEKKLVVDEEASEKTLKPLSAEDRKLLIAYGNDLFSSYLLRKQSQVIEKTPIELTLRLYYPNMSVEAAMKENIKLAEEKLKLLSTRPFEERVYYTDDFDESKLDQIKMHLENRSLGESEARKMLSWIKGLEYISPILGEESALSRAKNPTVSEIIQFKGGMVKALADIEKHYERQLKEDEEDIKKCKANYHVIKKVLPSDVQLKTLREDIEQAKALVIDLVKSRFPLSSQQKLIRKIESSRFILPMSKEAFESDFIAHLKGILEATKDFHRNEKLINPESLFLIRAMISRGSDVEEKSDQSGDNDWCGQYVFPMTADQNFTVLGDIQLSWAIATADKETRLGIITHELGHTISKVIEDTAKYKRMFQGVRKCLGDQHNEPFPESTAKRVKEHYEEDPFYKGPYVEEDFADEISMEATARFSAKNPWCVFSVVTEDGHNYGKASLQAMDLDPHSSTLWRTLRYETRNYQRPLPEACTNFVKQVGIQPNFHSCLDLAKAQFPN